MDLSIVLLESDERPEISRRALAFGICIVVVAIAFEAIAVATAMPAAAQDLNGLPWYGWAFSLFLIGMLFATVAAGRVCDSIGPARPMMVGVFIFAAGLVVAATSDHMIQLIAGRLVQGLGSGTINVGTYVVIVRVFDERHRPRMFSYISTAWVVPSFVGPPISAWLTQHLSWHWVFWAVLPLVAAGAALVFPTLFRLMRLHDAGQGSDPTREPAGQSRTRPAPLWAAGLAAVGAAAIQYAGQRLDLVAILPLLAGITCLLVSFPWLMPAGFTRLRRGLPTVVLVRGLLPGAFFGSEAFIPLMLVEQRHLSLLLAGGALTVGAVGWTTGSWIQSRPSLGLRRDHLITIGCCAVLTGISCIAITAWLGLWVGLVAVGWICAGFGMGISIASTSLASMTLSRAHEQGRSASSLQFGDALGSGVFVGVSGSIFAALHPGGDLALTFGTLLTAMVIVAALAAAFSMRIGPVRSEFAATLDSGQ